MLEVKSLYVSYGGVQALTNVSVHVKEGEFVSLIGSNGAGKTTTMKMILNLVHPSAGNISVFGTEMNQENRLNILKDIGSLIESPSYYGHLTGEENLRIISILKGVSNKEIERVLKIVRLEKQKDKKVSQYSLGMKQRLGIACALLGNPKLLILDEPTNGLDPSGIQEIRDLICSLPQKYDMTVMVSSHLLSEIDQMATHVGIINRGELIFQGSLASLHENSRPHVLIKTLNNAAAFELLSNHGESCELYDNGIVLPLLDDTRLAALVTALIKSQIGVYRVEVESKTLEDVFIQLTGSAVSL